jgi:hypothetical protein
MNRRMVLGFVAATLFAVIAEATPGDRCAPNRDGNGRRPPPSRGHGHHERAQLPVFWTGDDTRYGAHGDTHGRGRQSSGLQGQADVAIGFCGNGGVARPHLEPSENPMTDKDDRLASCGPDQVMATPCSAPRRLWRSSGLARRLPGLGG